MADQRKRKLIKTSKGLLSLSEFYEVTREIFRLDREQDKENKEELFEDGAGI